MRNFKLFLQRLQRRYFDFFKKPKKQYKYKCCDCGHKFNYAKIFYENQGFTVTNENGFCPKCSSIHFDDLTEWCNRTD